MRLIRLPLPLYLHLLLFCATSSVNGDINWGDCKDGQQDSIRIGLRDAIKLALWTEGRLGKLYDYVTSDGRFTEPEEDEQVSDTVVSTLSTWCKFMDMDLCRTLAEEDESEKRRLALHRLDTIRTVSWVLTENIENVTKHDSTKRAPKPWDFDYSVPHDVVTHPYINFWCSDDWIGDKIRDVPGTDSAEFEDNRPVADGGSPDGPGLPFVFPGRKGKPYHPPPGMRPLTSYVLNNLPSTYSSLISINSLNIYGDGAASPIHGVHDDLVPLEDTFHNEDSDAANAGEDDYLFMRGFIYKPEEWRLDQLLRYHLDGRLLRSCAETRTMATDYEHQRSYTYQHDPQQDCDRFLLGSGPTASTYFRQAYPYPWRDYWACINDHARNKPDLAIKSIGTYQLLATAMYLDDWDWSTGANLHPALVHSRYSIILEEDEEEE